MVTQELNDGSIQVFYIKSTDDSPIGADNGSILIEVDTGIAYRYDKENDSWWVIKSVGTVGYLPTRCYIYTGTDDKFYVGNNYNIYTSVRKRSQQDNENE